MKKFIFAVWLTALPLGAGAEAPVLTLSLSQAIELAISHNLSTKLAKASTEEARGQALELAADLLPHITGSLQQIRVFKVNLEAQGFPANNGFFNPLLGPFNSFDARLQLVQNLLDVNAIWKRKVGKTDRRISELEEKLARQQVATATALAYLEAQRTQRAVKAAQAEVTLSGSLFKLAHDQHASGISTGVDVARAETNSAQEQLRLIRAQVTARESDLRLKRVVGIPLENPILLPDVPRQIADALPLPEKAVTLASGDRVELQIAAESLRAAGYSANAAKAEHLPTIKALADYGYSGNTWDNVARTGSIGGRLDLPIFSGGSTHGRALQAEAQRIEAQERYEDAKVQVEEDVRLALQTLAAEQEETRTADQAADLAQKELRMARDRFGAGIGDNIQVLSAQTALDRALDDQVDAFARYDTARVNLAAALGHIEEFK